MPPTRFLSSYYALCDATYKRRGRQGDKVLLSLTCKVCGFAVQRSQVLPGIGFARANRMHAKMHNHIKSSHPADALEVIKGAE